MIAALVAIDFENPSNVFACIYIIKCNRVIISQRDTHDSHDIECHVRIASGWQQASGDAI